MNRPKVLYVIDSLQTGGAERSTLDIASHLEEFETVVCCLYKKSDLMAEFERAGVRVIRLALRGRYDFVTAYRGLMKVMKDERPSLVVATLLRSEVVSRLVGRRLGIRVIGTFVSNSYSRDEFKHLSLARRGKKFLFWFINMLSARYCAHFLSNGITIKESNCKALYVAPERVTVIYRGRDPRRFPYGSDHLSRKHVRILAVGRLLYRKGFQDLLDAFHEVIKVYPHTSLHIAGDGPFKVFLQKQVTRNGLEGSVEFFGNVVDVGELMRNHDMIVHPSHNEGFSGTLVEAMFTGIPIIASDIPMNQEAVEHNKTARIFRVMDSTSLKEEILWVIQNRGLAIDLAIEAREVAERRFTIDDIAKQHCDIYKKVLGIVNEDIPLDSKTPA